MMQRKWLRIVIGALAFLGAALSGCTPPSDPGSGNPILRPHQSGQPSTVAPLQQLAPAAAATLEPVDAPDASSTTAWATSVLTPISPASGGDAVLSSEDALAAAKADLAQALGLPAGEIELVVVIGQQFTSDAFYCRSTVARTSRDQPPGVIAGQTILLRAQGSLYEYHAASQELAFCRKLP